MGGNTIKSLLSIAASSVELILSKSDICIPKLPLLPARGYAPPKTSTSMFVDVVVLSTFCNCLFIKLKILSFSFFKYFSGIESLLYAESLG